MNTDDLEAAGFTVKRFCGVPVGRDAESDFLIACSNEAVGTLTVEIDEEVIPIEVCQSHLEEITSTYQVDTDGNHLVD